LTAALIVIAVLLSLAADLAVMRWLIRYLRDGAVNALREIVGRENVYHVEDCQFFGQLSSGYAQVRGNGLLALTDQGIHFLMILPRRHLFIPLVSVQGVSRAPSFLGKRSAKGLLRVDFAGEGGCEDACAFLVRSPDWWASALLSLISGEEPPPAPCRIGNRTECG